MKMLWVVLTIGVTFADKLDRTYLPPPGSTYSGGSPGAINVPLEFQKAKYSGQDGEFSKIPELVIGIDRVAPNRVDDTFGEIYTHKPKQPVNQNSLTSPTKTASSVLKQYSPLTEVENQFAPIPAVSYHLDHPSNNLDNSQQIQIVENPSSTSIFDEYNKSYLPPRGGNIIDNTQHLHSSTSQSPFNNDNDVSDEYTYNEPDSVINEHSSSVYPTNHPYFNTISSTPTILQPNYPNSINSNMSSKYDYHSVATSRISPSIPIETFDKKHIAIDKISEKRPERIQAESDRQAVILNYGQTLTPEGYAYGYETSNKISANEEGTATNGIKAKGSYSYIGDDGMVYQVEYTADENGFIPKGAHLPTSPPIPDAILKVIEQATRNKDAGVYDDGSYNEEKYGHKKYQGKYPQINNIINGDGFSPENRMHIEKNDKIDEYEDSQLNEIDKVIENDFNDFNNNFNSESKTIDNQDGDNMHDIDSQNIDLPNKSLNKNYNEQKLLEQPQNNKILTIHEQDVPSKTDKIKPNTASGYEYFPPHSPFHDIDTVKSFPSRFSGIDQDFLTEANENDMEKETAKPFLTPYVSRKDDDLEINYFDEQGNQETDGDEPTKYIQDNAKPISKLTNTDGEINSLEFIPRQQPEYGERIQNHLVSDDEEGYFYKKIKKPFITLNPRLSYTSSTAAPTESPTTTTQHVNHAPERNQSSFQTNATPTIDVSSTKSPISSSPTQTISPIILNESTSVYPDAYSETDLISTPESIQTSRPGFLADVPRFGMTYKSSTEANYPRQKTTENVIGEDFYGPKQSQRFDPNTGYHY